MWFASPFYHSPPEKTILCRPRPVFDRSQWAHPAHTYLAMSPVAHPVGAGVPDGPHRFSSTLPAGIFRAPARHPFAHGGKRMQKRRQRPMVFGIPFVRLQSRYKKVPHRIARTPIPAAAPAYRAKTFFSRAVQGKCFTSYIILYSAARRATPIYHSPPENATRSRVPRLNAPNGHTPPTLISPCLRSRTP